MEQGIKKFFRYCVRFGPASGARIYRTIYHTDSDRVRVPGIKAPIFLRPGSTDRGIFEQVFVYNHYKIDYKNPHTVIDAGANIGLFTVYFKSRFPDAKIFCIEPDQGNFDLLVKNVAPYNGVTCIHGGVWNKTTKIKVTDKYDNGECGFVVEESPDGDVQAYSIGDIMKSNGLDTLDVLKMDIETSEQHVFAENFEGWLPKIKLIIIETHDWMVDNTAKPFFEAINKSMNRYNYTVFVESTIIENLDIQKK